MKWLTPLLLLIIVAEAIGVGVYGSMNYSHNRVIPPIPPLKGEDQHTTREVLQLRDKVAAGNRSKWRELGETYIGLGLYTYASQCLEQAVIYDPEDTQAWYALGFTLERVGKTEEAIPALEKAAETSDRELATTCWYQIGRCYLRQEDVEAAEAVFRRIEYHPAASYQLVRILIRTDRYDEATKILDERLRLQTNSLKLLQLKEQLLRLQGEEAEAIRVHDMVRRANYELVLEYSMSFTNMFRAKHGLGKILSQAAHAVENDPMEDRLKLVSQATAIMEEDQLWHLQSVLLSAAKLDLEREAPDKALAYLDLFTSHQYPSLESMEIRAAVHMQKGEPEKALELMQRVASMSPTTERLRRLSDVYRVLGNEEKNRYYDAKAALAQGIDLFRKNKLDEAYEPIAHAIDQYPDDARAFYFAGEVFHAMELPDQARIALEMCLKLDENYWAAKDLLERLPASEE